MFSFKIESLTDKNVENKKVQTHSTVKGTIFSRLDMTDFKLQTCHVQIETSPTVKNGHIYREKQSIVNGGVRPSTVLSEASSGR